MPQQIIKQPDGKYALWSTVVDSFILFDCTPQDIIDHWVEQERNEISRRVDGVVTSLEMGGKPYYQFTMTFDECVARMRELNGDDCEAIQLMGDLIPKPTDADAKARGE
jgi:hypothetical protein